MPTLPSLAFRCTCACPTTEAAFTISWTQAQFRNKTSGLCGFLVEEEDPPNPWSVFQERYTRRRWTCGGEPIGDAFDSQRDTAGGVVVPTTLAAVGSPNCPTLQSDTLATLGDHPGCDSGFESWAFADPQFRYASRLAEAAALNPASLADDSEFADWAFIGPPQASNILQRIDVRRGYVFAHFVPLRRARWQINLLDCAHIDGPRRFAPAGRPARLSIHRELYDWTNTLLQTYAPFDITSPWDFTDSGQTAIISTDRVEWEPLPATYDHLQLDSYSNTVRSHVLAEYVAEIHITGTWQPYTGPGCP